jgi:hypothetical protein
VLATAALFLFILSLFYSLSKSLVLLPLVGSNIKIFKKQQQQQNGHGKQTLCFVVRISI